MTTEITVEIKGGETILDAAKTVQANARADYEEQKKEKKAKDTAEAAETQRQADEDDEYKGGIREDEEEDKPENRPKSRKCGFWIFKDYLIGRPDYGETGTDVPEERVDLDYDTFQLSVGTGDGKKWATHYFQGPAGKPATETNVTGSATFIGYLSYIQFYTQSFGTVYTLPEGATVVPYDPAYYLNPLSPPPSGTCPDGFCWTLFFPDELNSGPGRSRKNVTVVKKGKPVNAYEPTVANQAIFNFPINNKKTIVVAANWLGWSMGTGGEIYDGVLPDEYFLHPQNITQPSIRSTVYYKYPGGEETGWQPIYGYYWLMDPTDETSIMNLSRLGQLLPLDSSIIHNYQGQSETEVVGFAVGPNNVKKLDSIPAEVEAKVRARCPAPFWDESNIYWGRWNFRDVVDNIPGYPQQIDDIYNNASWEMNPDAHCMGIARNIFYRWVEFSSQDLPYDYWNRAESFDADYLDRSSVMTKQILGASPGIYDSYDLDLQDHAFYNHFGKGSWYDSWSFTYSVRDSWLSDYGDVRIHAGDIREGAWQWMRNIDETDTDDNPPWHITVNDLAWLYLRPDDRQAFIDNYKQYNAVNTYDFTPAQISYLNSAPEDPVFSYIYYARNVDAEKLIDGVKWATDGYGGAWTDANSPAFDYNDDPFYDVPYMDIEDPHWMKYRLKTKLSNQRVWPPSISSGFDDPVPANVPASSKSSHPLARGGLNLSYVINTAWDNDYSQVLLAMGFQAGDLNV